MKHRLGHKDRGAVLPLVLVVSFVLSAVVVAVARYGTTNLRYAELTERRSDQLAAADAAMSYALNLIEIKAADCVFNGEPVELPTLTESFNGATGEVDCSLTGGGLDTASLFAMVLTGEGLAPTDYLVRTQSGGVKEIGGPVFMDTVDSDAFALTNNNGLRLDAAPLIHYDGGSPCQTVSEDDLPDDLEFVPDEVYGPICTGSRWFDYGPSQSTFDEPMINADFSPVWTSDPIAMPIVENGGSMRVYDGTRDASTPPVMVPMTSAAGETEHVIVFGAYANDTNGCRVFEPGRYIRPPAVDDFTYLKSGDYLFDFRDSSQIGSTSFVDLPSASLLQSEFYLDATRTTAGKPDPASTFAPAISNPVCSDAVANDPAPDGFGATFYFARSSHLALDQNAVIEIVPRDQGVAGVPLYVSVHALCDTVLDSDWCHHTPAGELPSDRQAPGGSPSDPALVWIKAGNNSEIVANGLIWAPRAEMHFKNVSNSAEVRIRGGMVVARATIDASASAENFEIGVGSQDVDLELSLVATGTDAQGQTTKITSTVDLHYDEPLLEDRVSVLNWRVCESSGC